jgi:hypothetical protein
VGRNYIVLLEVGDNVLEAVGQGRNEGADREVPRRVHRPEGQEGMDLPVIRAFARDHSSAPAPGARGSEEMGHRQGGREAAPPHYITTIARNSLVHHQAGDRLALGIRVGLEKTARDVAVREDPRHAEEGDRGDLIHLLPD